MTPQELATLVFENLDPADTADFAIALRAEIENGHTSQIAEEIADKLETVGITIVGLPCKRHPTV